MSQSTETTRPDPLVDAYRQASEREGARAGADVRRAVLAHARVVAQSLPSAAPHATGLSDATRAATAANEQRPIWRLAAGVVIGLVGVWIFQLTRPSATPDTVLATASAPSTQTDKTRSSESVVADAPASPPTAAAPEAAVAVAAPSVAKDSVAKPANAARERQQPAALPDQNTALERALALKEKTDRPPVFAGASVAVAASAVAAPTPAPAADTLAGAISNEVVIASAETRKSAKAESRALPSSVAQASSASPPAAAAPAAAPNAFPSQGSEAIVAAAPAPRPVQSPAPAAAPWRAGASGAMAARGDAAPADAAPAAAAPQMSIQMNDRARVTLLSEADVAMFRAVRAGDIPALRVAITRGVNINAKDDRGRTALQIARERGDADAIKVLESAGAR